MEKKTTESPKDIFTTNGVKPTCGLDNHILLFDNLDGTSNPMLPLNGKEGYKIWQLTIMFVTQGHCKFNINNNEVEVNAGQVLVTHEDCILKFMEDSEDIKYFTFIVYPKTVYDIFVDIHLNYNRSQFSYSYKVGDVKPDDMNYFLDLYNEIKKDMQRPEYKYQTYYTRTFMDIIVVYIMNKFYENADMQADPSSRQYDMFCKFMDALNKHADKERSVQYYANLLGITSKYLSFVCLQYSQKNASSWIDEYVVAKARALQNVHHYNIKRISQELNFISPSSFTRFFKRVTGLPPTKK